MSATVLAFTGKQHGPIFERTPVQLSREQTALHDARQIKAAKNANDDWTSALLISLLASMERPQLFKLEVALATQVVDNPGAQQALALVRFANGTTEHRKDVAAMIGRMEGGAR